VGDVLEVNAVNYPEKLGWQDRKREFTFSQWNDRARRFANGMKALGVGFQERFGVISYNRGEWMDFYAGCAKGGQVIVPVMFRLAGPEIEYIVNHSECRCMIVESPFVELIDSIKKKLSVKTYVYLGEGSAPEGYISYEELLGSASAGEPSDRTSGEDVWHIMYTSGTTGRPKGVVRTHEATMAHYMLGNINMAVRPTDKVMLVMPMCHVNSIY
jgi:long-subunit acyl-CoA synthetase (AMP-forming)